MLGVVIGGKSRAGPSWQGESREPRAGAWAAFHAGFGKSRWKERTWGGRALWNCSWKAGLYSLKTSHPNSVLPRC